MRNLFDRPSDFGAVMKITREHTFWRASRFHCLYLPQVLFGKATAVDLNDEINVPRIAIVWSSKNAAEQLQRYDPPRGLVVLVYCPRRLDLRQSADA
jgi:hypothetical protein